MTQPTSAAAPKAHSHPLRGEGVGGRSRASLDDLPALEQTLWRTATRFDRALMDATFAPDLVEFGRSGRRYNRDDLLPDGTEAALIAATLHALAVTDLSPDLALVTYVSEVRSPDATEWANRSSIWDRSSGRWLLRFHQGTPCEALL